jgi:2'-5' RNA ligase
MSMLRLFVAIDIPETIRREVEGMGRSIPKARSVPADQLHLTLKFIGEVEGSRILDIDDALKETSLPKFSLCIKGVGTFPPRGTPRILWAGVQDVERVVALRNSIESTLAAINIPKERQKYTPHLTLARLQNCPIKPLLQYLAGNAFLQTAEFPVESFHLFSSQLTQKGALHTLERSYPLT